MNEKLKSWMKKKKINLENRKKKERKITNGLKKIMKIAKIKQQDCKNLHSKNYIYIYLCIKPTGFVPLNTIYIMDTYIRVDVTFIIK